MNSIDMLKQEHDNISRMLNVIHLASLEILQHHVIPIEDFRDIISFVRQYADKTHHGKEEAFLFKEMLLAFGSIGENLIRHGMLVEHDLGRLYISELEHALNKYQQQPNPESCLDVLISAGSYCHLLKRHIDKENDVIFTYGSKNLSSKALNRITTQMESFEQDPDNIQIRVKQLAVLAALEKKYN